MVVWISLDPPRGSNEARDGGWEIHGVEKGEGGISAPDDVVEGWNMVVEGGGREIVMGGEGSGGLEVWVNRLIGMGWDG